MLQPELLKQQPPPKLCRPDSSSPTALCSTVLPSHDLMLPQVSPSCRETFFSEVGHCLLPSGFEMRARGRVLNRNLWCSTPSTYRHGDGRSSG